LLDACTGSRYRRKESQGRQEPLLEESIEELLAHVLGEDVKHHLGMVADIPLVNAFHLVMKLSGGLFDDNFVLILQVSIEFNE
jgi:hypothetical protein